MIRKEILATGAGIFLALMDGMLGAYKLPRLWHNGWLSLCFAVVFIFSQDITSTLFIHSDLSELYACLPLERVLLAATGIGSSVPTATVT